jgi:hypothetical protein
MLDIVPTASVHREKIALRRLWIVPSSLLLMRWRRQQPARRRAWRLLRGLPPTTTLLGKLGSIFPWLRNWLDRPAIVPGRQRTTGGTRAGRGRQTVDADRYVLVHDEQNRQPPDRATMILTGFTGQVWA